MCYSTTSCGNLDRKLYFIFERIDIFDLIIKFFHLYVMISFLNFLVAVLQKFHFIPDRFFPNDVKILSPNFNRSNFLMAQIFQFCMHFLDSLQPIFLGGVDQMELNPNRFLSGHNFANLIYQLVKVRQNRNDFFKTTFPPKNERTNSFLLL